MDVAMILAVSYAECRGSTFCGCAMGAQREENTEGEGKRVFPHLMRMRYVSPWRFPRFEKRAVCWQCCKIGREVLETSMAWRKNAR